MYPTSDTLCKEEMFLFSLFCVFVNSICVHSESDIYLPLAINKKISSNNYFRLFAHNFSKEYLHKADKLDIAQLLKHLWINFSYLCFYFTFILCAFCKHFIYNCLDISKPQLDWIVECRV